MQDTKVCPFDQIFILLPKKNYETCGMKALEIPAQQSIDLFALNTSQECFHSRGVPQVPPKPPRNSYGILDNCNRFLAKPKLSGLCTSTCHACRADLRIPTLASSDVYRLFSSKGIGVVVLNQRF